MNVKGKSIGEVMSIDCIDVRQFKDVGATGRPYQKINKRRE